MKYDGNVQYGSGSFSELTEEDIPVPVQRLNLDESVLNGLDFLGLGVGNDMITDGDEDEDLITNSDEDEGNVDDQHVPGGTSVNILGTNIVQELSQATFREKLIKHFDIKFESQNVVWPRRKKKGTTI